MGSPQSPSGPLASPPGSRGGPGLVVPVPGGQPPTGGAHSSPAPLHPLGARLSCSPSLGPPALFAVAARCRLAARGGGGGRGSAGSGGSGQRSPPQKGVTPPPIWGDKITETRGQNHPKGAITPPQK